MLVIPTYLQVVLRIEHAHSHILGREGTLQIDFERTILFVAVFGDLNPCNQF